MKRFLTLLTALLFTAIVGGACGEAPDLETLHVGSSASALCDPECHDAGWGDGSVICHYCNCSTWESADGEVYDDHPSGCSSSGGAPE